MTSSPQNYGRTTTRIFFTAGLWGGPSEGNSFQPQDYGEKYKKGNFHPNGSNRVPISFTACLHCRGPHFFALFQQQSREGSDTTPNNYDVMHV